MRKPAKKRTPGRPSKYNPEWHPKLASALARIGLTEDQMAAEMGVATSTFKKWKAEKKPFSDAVTKAKIEPDDRVELSLYHRANGYSHDAVKILANGAKVDYVEHYPPDPASMIFWLKNRRPGKWREKQEIEHSGSVEPIANMTPEERRDLIASLIAKRDAQ